MGLLGASRVAGYAARLATHRMPTRGEPGALRHFLEMSGTHEGSWLMVQEGTHRPVRASIMLCLQLDGDGMLAQVGWGVAPEGQQVPVQT